MRGEDRMPKPTNILSLTNTLQISTSTCAPRITSSGAQFNANFYYKNLVHTWFSNNYRSPLCQHHSLLSPMQIFVALEISGASCANLFIRFFPLLENQRPLELARIV
jgi:hypothetical protein